MTDVDESLALKEREIVGKGLGVLRAEGQVPGVIHNHGAQSLHVIIPEAELRRVYREAGKHHPLNLSVGSQKFLALIKDMQMNPVNRRPEHVVFQAIRAGEKVEAEIPIRLEGEIPAEKVGLMVLRQLDTVQVTALPKDLPDELFLDATKLVELHDKLTIEDLIIPAGVTVLTEADHPIATVTESKAMMSEEAEAEDEAAETEEGADAETAAEGAEAPAGDKPAPDQPADTK